MGGHFFLLLWKINTLCAILRISLVIDLNAAKKIIYKPQTLGWPRRSGEGDKRHFSISSAWEHIYTKIMKQHCRHVTWTLIITVQGSRCPAGHRTFSSLASVTVNRIYVFPEYSVNLFLPYKGMFSESVLICFFSCIPKFAGCTSILSVIEI